MTSARTWTQTLEYFAEGVTKDKKIVAPTPEQFAAFVNLGALPIPGPSRGSRAAKSLADIHGGGGEDRVACGPASRPR